jgi:hypothetical protein
MPFSFAKPVDLAKRNGAPGAGAPGADALDRIARSSERASALALRALLGGATSETPLYGSDYLEPTEWRNDSDRPVAVSLEVTTAGPIGIRARLGKRAFPADTPGGRAGPIVLEPGGKVEIALGDAAVVALLLVADPLVFARGPGPSGR